MAPNPYYRQLLIRLIQVLIVLVVLYALVTETISNRDDAIMMGATIGLGAMVLIYSEVMR